MNRAYKVIWSKARKCYMVVSELAKSHSKNNTVKCVQTSATILLLSITFMSGSGYVGVNDVYAAGNAQWGGTVDGSGGVVIGPSSKGSGENTTVYGYNNTANGSRNTVIGNNNHISKKDGSVDAGDVVYWSTILGNNSRVRANDGIAIGDNVHTEGAAAIGLGLYTRATGAHSVAIGSSVEDWNTSNTATKALGAYSTAIGTASISEGEHSVAVGYHNYAKRNNAVGIGKENNAYGENGIAIGVNTSSGNDSDNTIKDTIAVGTNSKSVGNQSIALGKDSKAIAANTIAIGSNAQASAEQGIAIGMNTKAVANSVALGGNAVATEANTVSVGTSGGTMSRIVNVANATADHDAAAYNQLITNVQYKDGKIAFYKGKAGETATDPAKAAWSFDINGTAVTTENKAPQDTTYTDGNIQINKTTLHGQNTYDVKLNNNLNLTEQGSVVAGNTKLDTTGLVITDGPKVTKTGIDAGSQVVSNVTDGKISADSKDAINGSQLYKVEQKTIKNEKDIASIKTGDFFDQKTITNVTNKLTDGGEIAKDNAHLVTGGTIYTEVRPTDGSYVKTANTTAGNLSVLDTQTKSNTDAIAKNTDSIANIKTGNIFDQTAITNITNKLTDGGEIVKDNAHLVTGGTIYTEVRPADGNYVRTTNTTASNLMALDTQIGKLDQDGNYIKATGKDGSVVSISENLISLDQQAKTNTDAIAGIKTGTFFDQTTITNLTKKLTDGGAITKDNAHLVTGGTIYTEVRPTNGAYVKTANTTAANLNALDTQTRNNTDAIANIQTGNFLNQTTVEKFTEKLDVGQIEAGNTGLVSGGKVYEKIGSLDANKTYSYIKATSNISENLEHLDTAIASGSMLNNQTTVNNYIHKLSDGGKVEASNTKLVTGGTVYEAMQNASFLDNEKVINNFTSKLVTGAKVEAGNTKLVNGGMVHQAVQEEAAAREKADIALAKGINDIGRQIGSVDKRINKVGAGAAALAALHTQEFDPNDKWDFAVGYGHYKNANAGALGAFYKPNANMIVSVASTFGNGDPMVNAGVSLKIGAGGEKEKVGV